MNQVYSGEKGKPNFKLKNNRILFYAHKITLLYNILENQNLEKHSAA